MTRTVIAALLALLLALLVAPSLASADAPQAGAGAGAAPTAELVQRLEALTSKSTHATGATPKFAFTGNLSLEQPATFEEASLGFPDTTVADASKTFAVLVDPDTAWVSTQLGEYSTCGKTGCAKATPDSVLRATALFERTDGTWQPTAWSITPSIPGTSQQDATDDAIVPDKLGRDTTGADDVAKLFEASIGDPKKFGATFSDRKEVVLFGSELPERYVGGKAKATLASWNYAFVVRDGLRAGVSKSGNVAWVAANVDSKSIKRPKDAPLPFRMFALYEKTPTGWKVVQIQFSTAV